MTNFEVLCLVRENPSLSASYLAKKAGVKVSTLSSQLYKLWKKGKVQRYQVNSVRYKNFQTWVYFLDKKQLFDVNFRLSMSAQPKPAFDGAWTKLIKEHKYPANLGNTTRPVNY